jgi:flagellar hook-basal body complex protein FliE
MSINPTDFNIQLNKPGEVLGDKKKTLNNSEGGGTFGDLVKNAINSVNDAQTDANQKVTDFVSGKTDNVHEVMIAMEKAQLSFQLMTEVRNRLVDTYKELSRMPI